MPKELLGVRRDLVTSAPYVSPQRPARHRLNTNESPYPPTAGLIAEINSAIEQIALNRYPDRDAGVLLDALAGHTEWPREGIWIANGSNEVFMHLFLAFGGPGRTAMTFEPTYPLHTLIPRIAGTEVVHVERDDDLELDLDAALAAIERHKPEIVIVCSPNNPTGDCTSRGAIEALLDHAPGLVVVDEAYIEFAGKEQSMTPLLAENRNLVITRSFSKAWRLAGARLGYMLADPRLIEDLARVRLPYHLSAITQVIGSAALRRADEALTFVEALVEQRERMAVELQAMGVKCFPSRANFVLFEVDDAERVWNALLERDVLVRRYEGVPRLDSCLRVTAGLPDDAGAFLAAMKAAFDE